MCPNQPQRHQAFSNLHGLPSIPIPFKGVGYFLSLVANLRKLGGRTGKMVSLALQLCAFAALTVLASAIPISESLLLFSLE